MTGQRVGHVVRGHRNDVTGGCANRAMRIRPECEILAACGLLRSDDQAHAADGRDDRFEFRLFAPSASARAGARRRSHDHRASAPNAWSTNGPARCRSGRGTWSCSTVSGPCSILGRRRCGSRPGHSRRALESRRRRRHRHVSSRGGTAVAGTAPPAAHESTAGGVRGARPGPHQAAGSTRRRHVPRGDRRAAPAARAGRLRARAVAGAPVRPGRGQLLGVHAARVRRHPSAVRRNATIPQRNSPT